MTKEKMKCQCWKCGKDILSNENNVEFRYGLWENDLKPFSGIAIICHDCFLKIKTNFGGLQDI